MDKDKLDKLKKLLEITKNDTVTPKELARFLSVTLGVIKTAKDKFDTLSQENLNTLKQAVEYISKEHSKVLADVSSKTSEVEQNLVKKLVEVKALMKEFNVTKPKDGKPGKDADETLIVDKVLKKVPKAELDGRKEIVEKINTGDKNDLKIEAKQIEGMVTKETLDRAIGILDQRTQFLINKPTGSSSGGVSSLNNLSGALTLAAGTNVSLVPAGNTITISASGGGAVDSVNGEVGVVVLTTGDIAEDANANYVSDAQLVVIGNTSGTNTGDNAVNTQYSGLAASKQDTLVSATNIKTINGNSILGAGDLVVGGGGSGIVRVITITSGSATMGATAVTDYVYLVAGAHTMTLPTAVSNTNRYTVKNNHSAAITVDTTSAQTIDGTTTISINPQSSVDIISNNSNWFII